MRRVLLLAASLALLTTGAAAAESGFDATIKSIKGLMAYYRFTPASLGNSDVHGYTGVLENGATVGGPGSGPPVNNKSSSALVLQNGAGGNQDMISGGDKPLMGQIVSKGSLVAWMKLADLPSNQGRAFSIAGESAVGDDFDLQVQPNNQLCFFTDSGSATCATAAFTAADIGVWHLIVAAFVASGPRPLYIDGKLVGTSTAGGHAANQALFYVGESPVFTSRYFDGRIGDVAIYNGSLSGKEARALWKSRKGS